MNINCDKKIISELEIALSYYIKGLTVKENSSDFIFEIQRITENALLSYSVIDFRKDNFLISKLSVSNNNLIIDLNNEHCNYSPSKIHIKIKIPYTHKKEVENNKQTNYILGGSVKVIILNK